MNKQEAKRRNCLSTESVCLSKWVRRDLAIQSFWRSGFVVCVCLFGCVGDLQFHISPTYMSVQRKVRDSPPFVPFLFFVDTHVKETWHLISPSSHSFIIFPAWTELMMLTVVFTANAMRDNHVIVIFLVSEVVHVCFPPCSHLPYLPIFWLRRRRPSVFRLSPCLQIIIKWLIPSEEIL
jgi:hypothetical protein